MNESIIYQEEQHFYPWLIILIVVVCLLGVVIPVAAGVPVSHPSIWMSVLVIGIIFLVVWLFRKLTVMITPTHLVFGFPIWKKRLRLDAISVGGVVTIPFFAGAGIHCWGGKLYVNAKVGRGVSVSAGDKTYVIGSDSPESLTDAIQTGVGNW